MFIEMTDNEMINFNYVATIRKGYSKTYNSFTIYVNTIGEDNVVLQFETEEEMEKKWRWLQHIAPRQSGKVMCKMADDLISKESLLKEIDELIAQYNWEEYGIIMDILECVRDMVFDHPTAYDIDRVIEQLEELEKEHPYKVIGQLDTYSQYNEAWQDCMDRVLGIVKRSGEQE